MLLLETICVSPVGARGLSPLQGFLQYGRPWLRNVAEKDREAPMPQKTQKTGSESMLEEEASCDRLRIYSLLSLQLHGKEFIEQLEGLRFKANGTVTYQGMSGHRGFAP